QVRPIVCAVAGWRLWSGAFWRGFLHKGAIRSRCEELERAHQEQTAALVKLEQDQRDLEEESRRIEDQAEEILRELPHAEVARRRQLLETEKAALAVELRRLHDGWSAAANVGPEAPTEPSCAAVQAACQRWAELLHQEEHHEAFARQWVAAIE